MYKVLIADDEAFIRDRLKEMIPWTEYNLQVVAVAEDGFDALAQVKQFRPDIVITDIRMPNLDGLDMIARCRQMIPEIKFVVLSGFGEFEYAQKAINLGVNEYLLKPTQPDELLKVMIKLTDQLDQNHQTKEQQKRLKNYIPTIRSQYIHELISGHHPGYDWEEDAIFAELDWIVTAKNIRLFLISMDHGKLHDTRSNLEIAQFAVQNVLLDSIKPYARLCLAHVQIGRWVLIYQNDFDLQQMERLAEKLRKNVMVHTKIPVYIMISRQGEGYLELGRLYWEAEKAAEYAGQNPQQSTRYVDDDVHGTDYNFWIQPMKQLIDWIVNGNSEKINHWLRQIESMFLCWNIRTAKRWTFEWLTSLREHFSESSADPKKNSAIVFISNEDLRLQIISHNETEELFQYFVKHIHQFLKQRGENKPNYLVRKTLEIIQNQYHEDIYLSSIAEKLMVSTVYLSELFKKEVSKTFRDYLLQVRMNEAAKLLKDPTIKVYEVSYAVGYNKVEHFVRLFKKHFGMTPTEYRGAII